LSGGVFSFCGGENGARVSFYVFFSYVFFSYVFFFFSRALLILFHLCMRAAAPAVAVAPHRLHLRQPTRRGAEQDPRQPVRVSKSSLQ
jgi:hypothetical protein